MRPNMAATEPARWRALVYERCGLHFTDSRLYFLEQQIWERMTDLNISSYDSYYKMLTSGKSNKEEWLTLRDRIVNNESSFFRHEPSYDALVGRVLPMLMKQKQQQGNNSILLWSAGCSGGQEPYSMAMAALSAVDPVCWQLTVTGSDISHKQLAKAREGLYRPSEVRTIPPHYLGRHMQLTADGSAYRIRRSLKRFVKFSEINLSQSFSFWHATQDVIFCQNVLIYFTHADRLAIVQRLHDHLNPGGFLILGPTEAIGLTFAGLKPMPWRDVLVYQREFSRP